MKRKLCFLILFSCSLSMSYCQENSSDSSEWLFNTDVNFYFIPDDFFILPVLRADKNNLHLEARYNYEDFKTFSAWIGYNFSGGNNLEYIVTPMIGGIVGNTDGIAPGLELTFEYKNFELYSESEYLFDMKEKENNFFYNWTDLTYSPNDNLWFGISGQRTRLYKTDLEIQRGVFAGLSIKEFELTTYLYNLFFDDPFLLVTLSKDF